MNIPTQPHPAASKLPPVCTSKEAGSYLRFSEATVVRLARQGIIPGIKISRIWKFSKETILSLVEMKP